MTDSSPGDHGSRKSSAAAADNASLHSQPSSLLLSEDHYGSNVASDLPLADDNKFVNGKLWLYITNSIHENLTYYYMIIYFDLLHLKSMGLLFMIWFEIYWSILDILYASSEWYEYQ